MAKQNQDQKDFNKLGVEYIGILKDTTKEMQALVKAAQGLGVAAGSYVSSTSKASTLAKQLATYSSDDLKDRKNSAKFEKILVDAKKEQYELGGKIRKQLEDLAEMEEKRGKYSEEEISNLKKQIELDQDRLEASKGLVQESESLKKTFEEIDKKTKFWDDIAEVTTSIPVLGKVFKDFNVAAQASRDAIADKKNGTVAALKSLSGTFGKAGLAFAITKSVQGLKSGNERATLLARDLNISKDAGYSLQNSFVEIAQSQTGVIAQDLADSTTALSKNLGITANLSKSSLITFTALTKQLGLSTEAASKLAEISATTGQEVSDFTSNLIGNVKVQNANNKLAIRYQDILSDVASSSAATQISLERYPGSLAKAAYEARRVGLSLSGLESIANNILDFQSSISAELNAELLTGRELNLDRARMAAEMNDMSALSAEIAKNFGSAADFSKLSRTQQEGISAALGMSRDELASSLQRQEAITKLSSIEGATLEEKYSNELKRINAIANNTERTKQLADLNKKIGNDELQAQLKNQSVTEAQQQAMTKLADAASVFAKVLEPIAGAFQMIGKYAGTVLTIVTGISAALLAMNKLGGGKGAGTTSQFAGGSFSKGKQVLASGKGGIGRGLGKNFSKILGKTAGKSLLKKIPLVGAGAGLAFAAQRLMQGDITGAGLEAASGIAGSFPGIGTATSVGLDAALAGRDMQVDDFTIRSNPKDTLVMAGGTKFGEETNSLLRELISAVKAGGNVYIDGNKAGKALVLGSSKTT